MVVLAKWFEMDGTIYQSGWLSPAKCDFTSQVCIYQPRRPVKASLGGLYQSAKMAFFSQGGFYQPAKAGFTSQRSS